jgi:hypothetical protein
MRSVSLMLWSAGPDPETIDITLPAEEVTLYDPSRYAVYGYSSPGFDASIVYEYVKTVLLEFLCVPSDQLEVMALCGVVHWDRKSKLRYFPNQAGYVRPARDFKILHVFYGPRVFCGAPVLRPVQERHKRAIQVTTEHPDPAGREESYVFAPVYEMSLFDIKSFLEKRYLGLALNRFDVNIFPTQRPISRLETASPVTKTFSADEFESYMLAEKINMEDVRTIVLRKFWFNGELYQERDVTALIAWHPSSMELTSDLSGSPTDVFSDRRSCKAYRNRVLRDSVVPVSGDMVVLVRDDATGGLRPADVCISAPRPTINMYVIGTDSAVTEESHPHIRSLP